MLCTHGSTNFFFLETAPHVRRRAHHTCTHKCRLRCPHVTVTATATATASIHACTSPACVSARQGHLSQTSITSCDTDGVGGCLKQTMRSTYRPFKCLDTSKRHLLRQRPAGIPCPRQRGCLGRSLLTVSTRCSQPSCHVTSIGFFLSDRSERQCCLVPQCPVD